MTGRWLTDIHEAITNIEKYAVKGSGCFFPRGTYSDLDSSYHFQILGEAARNISMTILKKNMLRHSLV